MKTILVTGSNKGIGFEVARQLGGAGYKIIASARNPDRLKEAVAALRSENINAEALVMDIGDQKSVNTASEAFEELNLTLDVLINNAAVLFTNDRRLLQNDEVLKDVLNVNSEGALRVTKAFLKFMNKPGRIINVSSGGGSMSDPVGGWSPAYCVSKTLLNALTRHLSYELRQEGISVNAVCPGWVRTDMGGKSASRSVEKGAETIVWLADTAPQHHTGKIFRDKKEISW
jgi:NAD(P)-dependent dehydrogenase (short-subunit alcohol dehydrogenase family)